MDLRRLATKMRNEVVFETPNYENDTDEAMFCWPTDVRTVKAVNVQVRWVYAMTSNVDGIFLVTESRSTKEGYTVRKRVA